MNPVTYLKEVRSEMKKVVWPKKAEVVKLTATVIILSAIVGVYLGGIDAGFAKLLEILIRR
jgi:preprotein translocase subunit SecE